MTAEQFHDALSLLPMELVEEADRCRQSPKKKPIPWGRYAGLAACLVLLLGVSWLVNGILHAGGKSAEAIIADEAAPQMRENVGAGSVDTAIPAEAAPEEGAPGLSLLAVVEAPISADSSINYASPPQVQVIAQAADMPVETDLPEGWFDSHDLVAIFLQGYEEAPQPQEIWQEEDIWHVQFPAPAEGAYEAKSWYVLLEAPKGLLSSGQVHLTFAER